MKITIIKPYRTLKPGEIELLPKVNFWVGANGTGKSSLCQLLLARLFKERPELDKPHYWNGVSGDIDSECVTIEGMGEIEEVFLYSDKLSQVRWVDLDACFSLPGGLGLLRASEGQTSQSFFAESVKNRDRKNVLFIFDEIDGHLDYKTKRLFFNRFLPTIRGTTIVISHDSLFLIGSQVFDFGDWSWKEAAEYYIG